MLHKVRESLCKELEGYGSRNISKADLDTIYKLASTIKNIDKIEMGQNYSMDGGWEARGMYSRDNMGSYGGHSYGNDGYSNGMHYVRGHYSRDNGYSMHDSKLVHEIDQMMNDQTISSSDREALRRAKMVLER